MKIKEKHFILIAFAGFLVFLFIGIQNTSKRQQLINEDIDSNLFVTTAKLKDCRRYYLSYIYYFYKKKQDGLYKGDGGSDSKIGKYFIVEVSKKKPQFSRLSIEKEIQDPIKI